jgi:hypothetical protein
MNFLPTPKLPVWPTAIDPYDEDYLEQEEFNFNARLQRVSQIYLFIIKMLKFS